MPDDFKGSGKAALRVAIATLVVLILCAAGLLGYLLGGGDWSAVTLRPPPTPEGRPPATPEVPPPARETGEPEPSAPREPVASRLDSEVPLDEPAPEPVDPDGPAEKLVPDDLREMSSAAPPPDESPSAESSDESVNSLAVPAPVDPTAPESAVERPETAVVPPEPVAGPVIEEPEVVGDPLASLTPLEVRGVDLGEQALVREITLARRERQVIWALPLDESHSSHISYFLEDGYQRLRGTAIVVPAGTEPGDEPDEAPAAVFRIYGDSNLLWESAPVRGRDTSHPFDVNVRNVEMLVLVVENLTPESEAGFAWADLELFGEPAS